ARNQERREATRWGGGGGRWGKPYGWRETLCSLVPSSLHAQEGGDEEEEIVGERIDWANN
ncbi:unnamed protein product, partial [Musa hybrid cultivar]